MSTAAQKQFDKPFNTFLNQNKCTSFLLDHRHHAIPNSPSRPPHRRIVAASRYNQAEAQQRHTRERGQKSSNNCGSQ
eukprot:1256000-Pleurochrysis_carterae.AAC.1